MKNFLLLLLLIAVLFGCKDDEEDRLMKMRADLAKDWQIYSVKVTEPQKFKETKKLDDCYKLNIWSFSTNGDFNFRLPSCNSASPGYPGFWKIEGLDKLKITFQPKNNYVGDLSFNLGKVSPDTLKLREHVIIYDKDNNYMPLDGVEEYTFIRK